jgi:predicted component of type VI protein secretion system
MGDRIFLHKVKSVRVSSYAPDNSHAVAIEITRSEGREFILHLFDMEEGAAMRVVAALSDAASTVSVGLTIETMTDYLLAEKVIDKMEGDT